MIIILIRDGSMSPARSKIKPFMTRANGWKSLTVTKKNSNQDPEKVLDLIQIIVKMVYIYIYIYIYIPEDGCRRLSHFHKSTH